MKPERTAAAINDVAEDESVGERPYEMVWAARKEERTPLVDFEDVAGWHVHMFSGAEAGFRRTREQQMWGQFVGKLTYKGTSPDSRVVIQPAQPVPIREPFDCVNFWVYGNNWGWSSDPSTPQVALAVLVADARGAEHRIELTRIRWKEWWLVHRRIPKDLLEKMAPPCSLSGIEIAGCSNVEPRTLFFDSLYFYEEQLKPLRFEPRPARNLKLLPGQGQGLNGAAPGRLRFPTREQTILPSNFEKRFRTSVTQPEPGLFRFRYKGKDADVVYEYRPRAGDLGEITARLNGGNAILPMAGGGLKFDGPSAKMRLASARLVRGEVVAAFLHEETNLEAEYRLKLWQKSLVMDVICRGGAATELSLGEARRVRRPRLVLVPYLTFASSNPRILLFELQAAEKSAADRALPGQAFMSVWVDWYRSNGSELFSEEFAKASRAKINGGVRYNPRTDGKRNDLFERVFLTVSPCFEETLPTIANPPSPWGRVSGERLWQESWGPQDYEREHSRCRALRSYGIEKMIQCNHEITWRDGGESFTLRTRAAPGRGGDEGLRKFVEAQKSLGWRVGLYTNYTDYAPVDEYWDEDAVQRTPDGEWRRAWPRCYGLKPSRAVEFEAKLAPVIEEKFDQNSSYTDVHTAAAPWGYCDYDARVPGGGTFAATFYAYGELLLNDRKVYNGPIFSEGTYQWLYAGLTDGNYGLAYTDVDLSEEPLNVAFDLHKIHPLECDIGMPWTSGFFKKPGWESPERIEESIDHFMAATIAYGHIGWLVEEAHGIRRTCRSYYMLQQLQKRCAMQRPRSIHYADSQGNWVTVSQALASGAIRDSRLRVVYENGLTIFVNGSKKNWALRLGSGQALRLGPSGGGQAQGSPASAGQALRTRGRKMVVLPPWGWYASHAQTDFFEASRLVDGKRADIVESPEYDYLDGRGTLTQGRSLRTAGAAVLKRARGGRAEIIDIEGNEEIAFKPGGSVTGNLTAYDADAKPLGRVPLVRKGSWLAFKPVEGGRKYIFRPSAGQGSKR